MSDAKPPIGVMPYWLWHEQTPEPTIDQLLARYAAVSDAVERVREMGLHPSYNWLLELLGPQVPKGLSGS